VGLVREASPKRHKETTMQHVTLPSAKALHLPFCSAVRAGDFLFLSGAIGNRPGTMNLVEGGLSAQARQAMENIGEVLGACGLGFADAVKFTIMLADMRRWAEFNAVYLRYFDPDRLPARSAFGASGLALGGGVEIECVAYWPGAR
jgi:2-iminobutanoate/2-iminopropanoate deaminase